MKRQLQISGTYKINNETDSFTGTVTFDERVDSIYYSWNLRDSHGNTLGGKSMNITVQQIPAGQDKFEYSKAHAIEGIKKYRIAREKIIQNLHVD